MFWLSGWETLIIVSPSLLAVITAFVPFETTLATELSSEIHSISEYLFALRLMALIFALKVFPAPEREITFCVVVKYTSGSRAIVPSGYTVIEKSHEYPSRDAVKVVVPDFNALIEQLSGL